MLAKIQNWFYVLGEAEPTASGVSEQGNEL
jgi:hypothetical protein